MATVPLSGTNIKLLSRVPFSNDYKHTRWFETEAEQVAYFNSSEVDIMHISGAANFQRMEGKTTFVSVNKSIDELFSVNYLRFQNTAYNSKWFYAFVTKLEYVQRNTTYVHFEIDVLQTWRFNYVFRPSFVVREHCKLWNDDGSPVINTVDEGLNYGTEYDTVSCLHYPPNYNIFFLVIVSMKTIHDGAGLNITPSIVGVPQPLTYYLHPFRLNDTEVPFTLSGGIMTPFNVPSLKDILQACYTDVDAVGEIVSLFVTEHCGLNLTYFAADSAYELSSSLLEKVTIGGVTTILVNKTYGGFSDLTEFDCGGMYDAFTYGGIGGTSFYEESTAPTDGDPTTNRVGLETKLLMHPYSYTTLEDNKGNHVVLKNEYINNVDHKLNIKVLGSMGLSNKVAYIPYQYGNQLLAINQDDSSYEYALINDAPMDVPIISNYLSAYLQGNRNSLRNQLDTVMFDGAVNVVGGVIGTAASLGTGSAVGVASSITSVVKGAGNAVLQVQGMMAKQKDAKNIPPTLKKMGSNTAFDFGNSFTGFFVKKKQIKPEYQKKLSHFFKTYGYKMNEVKMPNFHTRQNWNYVQTNSCVIYGSFNAEDLNDLRQIFDSGITLWHTDDVGNYSLSNGVI